jgi:hypothetical protein
MRSRTANSSGCRSPQAYSRTRAGTQDFKKNAQLHTQLGIHIGGAGELLLQNAASSRRPSVHRPTWSRGAQPQPASRTRVAILEPTK